MFNLHNYFKVCAAASLAALLGAPSYALADRLFRVELLVFSQEGAATTEQFEAIPNLAYPDVARFLVEPQRVKANKAKFGGDGSLDRYGRQIVTRSGGGVTAGATPGLPTAFVALPSAQREFRGKAAYMQRSGRYRTVFHETWVQPVTDKARSVPIVLDRSGDTGQWPALQGSITLHLARYLHLSTNLWLNTQGDYLPGEWRMPAPPLGPPSVLIDGMPAAVRPTAAPQAYSPAQDQEGAMAMKELGPVYPYRHAVLLKQKRRMRSNEVHYIDHPLMGVVIKLTPLTADAT